MVYLLLKINAGKRILEEEKKYIIYEVLKQVPEDEKINISTVDYKCVRNN